MSDYLGWRRIAADSTAERLALRDRIETSNGPDTSELVWAADEDSPELGLRIVRPRTREDYYYEGTLQNNCISGDQIDAFSRYPVVYSVRDENNLPLVSYEARYVPLSDWQSQPDSRDRFFGAREGDDMGSYHIWRDKETHGPGVLMTRQVCSVGNHVPGEEKLRAFLKSNIGLMKQRGLDYMQYITAEGEHQPGTCTEGCPSQERETLQRNPLLSLDDLEAIIDSGNRKIAPGTKVYLSAPIYSANEDNEIEADAHRDALRILPVGKAFQKKAQAEDDDSVPVEIEGQTVRVPRDYMVIPVDFNERQLSQGEKIHDMLLNREGNGGGLTIAPNARFTVRDAVYKPQPKFLAVTQGSVSPGLNSVSSQTDSYCAECLPEEHRHLKVDAGKFVYDDNKDQYKDHILVPLDGNDMHKFSRKGDGEMEFNDLADSLVPFERLYRPDESNFSSVKRGQREGHAHIPASPMEDESGNVLAASAYGILASPKTFAPERGLFGNEHSVVFANSYDTVNHHGSRGGDKWTPTRWLIKTGTDAFHHAKAEEHDPVGDVDAEGNALPAELQCGKRTDNYVDGTCGQPHHLFIPAKTTQCPTHGDKCSTPPIRMRDLIYVGPEHAYEGSEDGTAPCRNCGVPQSAEGSEADFHGKPLYMQEPHVLWDSESKKWTPNVDESGNNLGGTSRLVRTGQDMGASDFRLVTDADAHLASIKAPTFKNSDNEDVVWLPSNISLQHKNLNPASYREGDTGTFGLSLSALTDPDRHALPGPLFTESLDSVFTPKTNPELFAASTHSEDTFINPEAVDVEMRTKSDGASEPRYFLRKATKNPMRVPKIYFRTKLTKGVEAPTSSFSEDGSIASGLLQLSSQPFANEHVAPTGEIDTHDLSNPKFVCRRCGDAAILDSSEDPDDRKKSFKVYCDKCSKKWYQCPGGKTHRAEIRENGQTSPDDTVQFLGLNSEGLPEIHCRTCRDQCGTCKSFGWVPTEPEQDENQQPLFDSADYKQEIDRKKYVQQGTRPENSKTCPSCNGEGYQRRQRQVGSVRREPVMGQKRGTVGLVTADHITVFGDGSVGFEGKHRTFDSNGEPEERDLKVPASALRFDDATTGLNKGKAEFLRRVLSPLWRSSSVVLAADSEEHRQQRLRTREDLTTTNHAPCGGSGNFCDGTPHTDIKERDLWSSPDYSLKHLLNSDAFWVEGDLQTHCLGWNYQARTPEGGMRGKDPNAVSLRDKDNLPLITGDLRVVSLQDYRDNGNNLNYSVKGVTYDGWANEDWRQTEPDRPVPLPGGQGALIDPLFSNDTWTKEIIRDGQRQPHPDEGVLLSRQLVTENDRIPENEHWLPFLKAIHKVMTDRDIKHFAYTPYSQSVTNLLSRDQIGDIIARMDVGDRMKGKKVYVQVPVANYDADNPQMVKPDSNSKILQVGEAFSDVA